MGGSGKWLKSLINLKKSPTSTDQSEDRGGSSKKKWKLWRSSSEGTRSKPPKRVHVAGSERSDSSSFGDDSFAAAIATLARAHPRDFRVVKQEWAAIRIQTAFRGLLARCAFRALRAVVRIQALFRGRQVRKQAAVTLRCMQALVRVQARVRAWSVRMSSEGQPVQKPFEEFRNQADPVKQSERGWCDSPGTVDEVKAKLQMRQEGVIKRERALAYSLFQKQAKACPSPARTINKLQLSLKTQRPDCSSPGHNFWIATKAWENTPTENLPLDLSQTPFSRTSEDNITAFYSNSCKHDMIKVRKTNVTTKVLAKCSARDNLRSHSAPSSECFYDESSASSSSISASPIPLSSSRLVADKVVDNYNQKPSYMNLTESIKAKQYASRHTSQKAHRHLVDDHFKTKSMELSSGDTKSSASSNPSGYLTNDLYLPIPLGRRDENRGQRQLRRPTLITS